MKALGFEHAARLYRRCLKLPVRLDNALLRSLHLKLADALTQAGHLAEAGEVYLDAAKYGDHLERSRVAPSWRKSCWRVPKPASQPSPCT